MIFAPLDQLSKNRPNPISVAMIAGMATGAGQCLLARFSAKHQKNENQSDNDDAPHRGRWLRRTLSLRFKTKASFHSTRTRSESAPPSCENQQPPAPQDTQSQERQQAGAATLQRARTHLRATLRREFDHGVKTLSHAECLIVWPRTYKPRPRVVSFDQRLNPRFQYKRPRCMGFKPSLGNGRDGQQRMVEHRFDDETPERHHRTPPSQMRALEDPEDDFEENIFDLEDDLALERDIAAACEKHCRRLGCYAVSYSRLCKLTMALACVLEKYYEVLREESPSEEKGWRRLVSNARTDLGRY